MFSTGLDASGHALADGAADAHYALISGPSTAAPVVLPQGGFPFPYWSADDANSEWITPGDAVNVPANAANGYQEPQGDYDYRTTFDLSGYDPTTASITGQIGADNRVLEVLLNGVDVAGYSPTAEGDSDFASLRSLNISGGFVTGVNTLDFVVENYAGDSSNPTGFRAALSGTAQMTGTPFATLTTGVDDAGNLLPGGATDPHWQLTSAPESISTAAPYVTIQNGYPYPYWTADGPNSQWISPNANENDMAGGATDAVGDYTYQTTFDLTGFDPSTAHIAGLVSADNTLEQVLLNGQDVGYVASGGNDYTGLHSLVIDSGFVSGINTLTFVVYNAPQPDGTDNAHNPSAFRAELTGTAVQPPQAGDDVYSVLASGTTTITADNGVLANDSDPAGNGLTAVPVAGPSYGALTLNPDGSFSYTPGAGFAGSDSFTYEALDGTEYSAPATVTLTTAPVATDNYLDVTHDQTLTVSAADGVLSTATDADGGTMTAVLVSGPTNGSLTLNADGSFSYTPAFHYLGSDSFTFQAQEGTQLSATATVSLNVMDSAPQGYPAFYGTPENSPLTVTAAQGVLASDYDADGDALSAALVGGPADGALTLGSDGGFVYTPNTNWYGTDSFTYQASDGLLDSDPVTVTIEVDQVIPDTEANAQPYAVALADFNGDGNLDAAVVDKNQGTVSFLLGDGAGNLTAGAVPDVAVGVAPVALVVGNFGDGGPDLAVANSGSNSVSILLGGGSMSAAPLATGNDPVALAEGDFNGDGKLDLAVVNQGDGTVSLFLGNGDGTFSAGATVAVGASPTSVAVGDFNGDGKADLAVTDAASNEVFILLGNGDGTFQTPLGLAVGAAPSSVAVGDFNGDGLQDLAVANSGDGTVSVLLGNGDGTFQAPAAYGVGSDPVAVAVGDFNGDGALDLSVVNKGSNSVTDLYNAGDGTFQETITTSTPFAPTSAAVGDLNNDGLADQVVACAPDEQEIMGEKAPPVQPEELPTGPFTALTTKNNFQIFIPNPKGGLPLATLVVTAKGPIEGLKTASVEATLTPNTGSIADLAKSLGVDHFNFYQYGEIVKDDPTNPAATSFLNKDGKPIGTTFVDSPSGGLFEKGADGKLKTDLWSDNLPWYFDESSPPKDIPIGSWRDAFLASHAVSANGKQVNFEDVPHLNNGTVTIQFNTWLVGVDANGKEVLWLPGFSWEYSITGGNINAATTTLLKPLKPINKTTEKALFTDLATGFTT